MNWPLILHFSKQDLRDRYAGSMLGGLWAFITPLLNILMFAIVFSEIMGARMASLGAEHDKYNYSIYLIAGIVPWTAFASTLLRVTTIYRDKSDLIGKINTSLISLPLYIVISEGVIFAISYTFFVGFLLLIHFPVDYHWFHILYIFAIQQALAYSIGLTLAIFSVFIEDIRELIPTLIQFWFWLTPVVYVVNVLPESISGLLNLNPYFHLVNAYRAVIIEHSAPAPLALISLSALSVSLLAFNKFLLSKLERDIRDFI